LRSSGVEESALPVRRTLEKIGIPRATFYRWYLDDFSCYTIAWKLSTTMKAEDVTAGAGCRGARQSQGPPSAKAAVRTTWRNGWSATTWPTSAGHPMTQGKIERWHQTLKNPFCWRTITGRAI
jgi:transposase InsO family protein